MKKHILLLASLTVSISAFSQLGYGISSASYAYHHGGNGNILPSKSIVEEEIFNYHEHKIDGANYNDPITISYMWGNEKINANANEMILQIGIATHRDKELKNVAPANLSLVVDVSGSMGGGPLEKSKEAIRELVKQLRPSDQVSLVLFGSTVSIPFKSQKIGNKAELLRQIDAISINGSTNVHLGMLTGYQQVASTFLNNGSNRVIVFTDAMANTGLVDPKQILANTKIYIKDIDLTFIGIGVGFNQDFAREIKTKLRGHMHFVEDSREITKLFKEEVEQFLTAPHAKKVKLTIELPEQLILSKFYGYNPTVLGNKLELELDDLQGGLTQIFMLKFTRKNEGLREIDAIKCELSFNDQHDQATIITQEIAQVKILKNNNDYNKLENLEVKKNYCIVYMARKLKEASINYEGDKDAANYYLTINNALATIDAEYKTLDDDLTYVYDLLSKQSEHEKHAKSSLADTF
ncbi:MAG: VWA domain-containing protein [Crocinitomicaceae bacterium]|nr:VWA domain-containing protein [Flavobacteriales bacterium]NQZ38212.1 VWA domain-containing protein [Crocinitomicaceae bacterium]